MPIIIASMRYFQYVFKKIDALNLKLLSFCMHACHAACLRFEFRKFRIFKILNFHPCTGPVKQKR